MKKLILILSLSLTLTACGGGSDNNAPDGAAGLWVEALEVDAANRLDSFSLQYGECAPFMVESGFPQFEGTLIERNGNMLIMFSDGFEVYSDDSLVGQMNPDGFVTLNAPDDVIDLGFLPEIRFEVTGVDTAISTATFLPGSLSDEQIVTELLRVSDEEFISIAGRVDRYCNL